MRYLTLLPALVLSTLSMMQPLANAQQSHAPPPILIESVQAETCACEFADRRRECIPTSACTAANDGGHCVAVCGADEERCRCNFAFGGTACIARWRCHPRVEPGVCIGAC